MSEIWTLLRLSPLNLPRYTEHLGEKFPEVEYYFPQYQRKVRPARQRHAVLKNFPVYPGYLFAKLDPSVTGLASLTQTPVRAYFVRFGTSISVIPNTVILNLKQLESLNLLMTERLLENPFAPGKPVRIHTPIADLDAIIIKLLGDQKAVVDTPLGTATIDIRFLTPKLVAAGGTG